jgi:two-component system, NarL family, response regulator DegU
MDQVIKVILADDHQSILNSISSLLNNSPNIKVVATAENGERAIALTRSEKPDVLILDIDMPKLNGLQVSARLNSLDIEVKIVILSIYDEPSIVYAAFKQGVRGYVLKERAASDLVKAIQLVNGGERFLSAPLIETDNGSRK